MNKLIGFTISRSQIDHSDVDVFNRGLSIKSFIHNGFHVYLWGIGNINECIIHGNYSLSFPLSDSLLDRNVIISIHTEHIDVENDWLGSIPIFYNRRELIASTLSLKTLRGKGLHPEGLHNFFEFGYSVFEQTIFEEVRFLRYYSHLVLSKKELKVVNKEDPVLEAETWSCVSEESEVYEEIKQYIYRVESVTQGEIILPTSGGYDSRLLNLCINNRDRVNSFTYGISDNQANSFEVIYAREIAKRLGTKWHQVWLSNYYEYVHEWHKLLGFSTHLHGMYHIEFYKRILEKNSFSDHATFLSGIVGDVWSGRVGFGKLTKPEDLRWLGYSHGLSADPSWIRVSHNTVLRNRFWQEFHEYLEHDQTRIVFSMRFKIILLSYLTIIPEYFGWIVWTPFLNFSIAKQMLCIPEERREERVWQRDLFKKEQLDLSMSQYEVDYNNTLSYNVYYNSNVEKLSKNLNEVIDKKYIRRINRTMRKKTNTRTQNYINSLLKIRYLRWFLFKLGYRIRNPQDITISAPYKVLKAIDLSLE